MRLSRPSLRMSRNIVAPVLVALATAIAVIVGVAIAVSQQGDPRASDGVVTVAVPTADEPSIEAPQPLPSPEPSVAPVPTPVPTPVQTPVPTVLPTPGATGTPGVTVPVLPTPGGSVPGTPGASPQPSGPGASASPSPAGPTVGLTAVVPVGSGSQVDSPVIGLHQNGISSGSLPHTPFGAVRLWDSGTTWRELEPTRDAWNYAPLDRAVAAAASTGARPLLVLGQTPAYAATKSTPPAFYGPGANSVPNLDRWKNYVRTVALHYKGRIREYEIWNEPNVVGFWAGTPEQMVTLAVSARAIIHGIDPGAVITTPGLVVRRPTQRGWLSRYLSAGGAAAADVVNIHLYPEASATPEDVAVVLSDVRARLAAANATQPIWDTEINYGLPTGGASAVSPLAPSVQAGYVARTFLIGQSLGLARSYWYSFDNQQVGVRAANPDGSLTSAGKAFATTYGWLVGHEFRGCAVDASRVWSCYVDHDRIVWAPIRSVKMTAPAGTTAVVGLTGRSTPTKAGTTLTISSSPVKLVGAG